MTDIRDTDPKVILSAMREAGDKVAEYLRRVARTPTDRDFKRDRFDVVTEHDRQCEEIAVDVLRRAIPDCRIVGEEKGERPGDSPVTFYVDPIDGTANFAAGMPTFAFSVGAEVDGELIAGVVNAPLLGHEFYAAKGHGSWVTSFDREEPIRLGEPIERTASESLVLTGFPSARDRHTWGPEGLAVAAKLATGVLGVRNLGSAAIDIACVAAGWADAAYGVGANPWDTAGGIVLVMEAGGQFLHSPLRGGYGDLPWQQPGYGVIAPGRTIPQIGLALEELEGVAGRLDAT
ncbi:inositol monophosphatase family protein [Flaviflexus huanghaiensis]|uniref:inositol monophosphatase family protein n=1 Tax=Flaviflexus huanghaiensis TaxID=1111473 RepID=UPI0015FB29CA|nr:inositol monophosphatase family protein [Flaviflexus huanghaiensis]